MSFLIVQIEYLIFNLHSLLAKCYKSFNFLMKATIAGAVEVILFDCFSEQRENNKLDSLIHLLPVNRNDIR